MENTINVHHFKKVTFIFFFLLLGLYLHAQSVNQNAESSDLLKEIPVLTTKIASHSFGSTKESNFDSLQIWNDQLESTLKRCALILPNFMTTDFHSATPNGLVALQSSDHLFKIICWNDGMSGTLQEWIGLAFWKTKSGIRSTDLSEKPDSDIGAQMPEYTSIHDFILANGNTVYLVIGIMHEDNRWKYSFVQSFTIENNGNLNTSYPFFKTRSQTLSYIGLEMDLGTVDPTIANPFIHLSGDNQSMLVPIVDKNGKVSQGKYLIYKFDGNNFVYKGIQ